MRTILTVVVLAVMMGALAPIGAAKIDTSPKVGEAVVDNGGFQFQVEVQGKAWNKEVPVVFTTTGGVDASFTRDISAGEKVSGGMVLIRLTVKQNGKLPEVLPAMFVTYLETQGGVERGKTYGFNNQGVAVIPLIQKLGKGSKEEISGKVFLGFSYRQGNDPILSLTVRNGELVHSSVPMRSVQIQGSPPDSRAFDPFVLVESQRRALARQAAVANR